MDSNSNDEEEDEEEEHSSDSDEQEDVDVEQQEQVVLTSQDAFQELTAEMDTAAEVGSGSGKEVSAEKKAKDAQFESWLNDEDGWADFDDKQDTKDTKDTKDVDGNDRQKQSPQSQQLSNGNVNGSAKSHGDGDVDGGGDDKENNEEQSHPQPQQPQQEQSSVQQQQPQPAVDDKDFANWDEDPFPDDDVFGAPEAAAAASSPDKAKEIVKDIEVVSDAAAEVAVDSA